MEYPFASFTPSTPPETVLTRIKRGARVRLLRRATALAALVAVALLAVWLGRPVPPPLTQQLRHLPGRYLPVVKRTWRGDKEVPYTLLKLPSGRTVIVIQKSKEDI